MILVPRKESSLPVRSDAVISFEIHGDALFDDILTLV